MGRSRRLSSGSRPLPWSPHLYHLYDWWGEWLSPGSFQLRQDALVALPSFQSLAQAGELVPAHSAHPCAQHKQPWHQVCSWEWVIILRGLHPAPIGLLPCPGQAGGGCQCQEGMSAAPPRPLFPAGSTCAQPHSWSSRTQHTPALLGQSVLPFLNLHHQFSAQEKKRARGGGWVGGGGGWPWEIDEEHLPTWLKSAQKTQQPWRVPPSLDLPS